MSRAQRGLQFPSRRKISNRTPWPPVPVSRMVAPVIANISLVKKRPRPMPLPRPISKMRYLSQGTMSISSSSMISSWPPSTIRLLGVISVACPPCRKCSRSGCTGPLSAGIFHNFGEPLPSFLLSFDYVNFYRSTCVTRYRRGSHALGPHHRNDGTASLGGAGELRSLDERVGGQGRRGHLPPFDPLSGRG